MKIHQLYRVLIFYFCFVGNINIYAQFDKNYTPITFEGSIPSVFIENPFETTQKDVAHRNKDVLTKKEEITFSYFKDVY